MLRTGASQWPVWLAGLAAISSGGPVATIWPPPLPPFGSHVDDPVGGLDDVEVVLDDEEGAAAVDEFAEGGEELSYVVEVEAGGGLVEDVEGAAASFLCGVIGGDFWR